MKNFRNFMNHSATQGVLIIMFLFALMAGVVIAENLDIQSPRNAEIIAKAKANCEQRGGQHIANPHGRLAFLGKANGQGCSLDYDRWDAYRAEFIARTRAERNAK